MITGPAFWIGGVKVFILILDAISMFLAMDHRIKLLLFIIQDRKIERLTSKRIDKIAMTTLLTNDLLYFRFIFFSLPIH